MVVIEIWLQTPTQLGLLTTIEEGQVRRHSVTVDSVLTNEGPGGASPLVRKITLQGAAPAALKHVMNQIRTHNNQYPVYIKVHDIPFVKALVIFEAVQLLQVTDPQPHIEGHIVGYISHNKLSVEEILAAAKIGYARRDEQTELEKSKILTVLIHQTAWDLLHEKQTYEGIAELVDEGGALGSVLVEAIAVKQEELREKLRRGKERAMAAASRQQKKDQAL